ncbi:MAG: hypothetical protein ACRBF0_11095 [Calditrichia bacterium]
MMNSLFVFIFVLILPSLTMAQDDHAKIKPLQHAALASDEFAGNWRWIRQDTSLWHISEDDLQIMTNGSLWNSENTQKNILLIKRSDSLESGFVVEVHVDGHNAMTGRYEHVGLIFYADDDNWITLTLLNHVQDKAQKIMLVPEEQGRGRADKSSAVVYTESSVVLRMIYNGSSVSAYYRSPRAVEWRFLGSLAVDDKKRNFSPGLVAGYNSEGTGHWVSFKTFAFRRLD